jgi:transposase
MLMVSKPQHEEPRSMLTQGEDVEVHALAARGWSISAIARHLGRDRRTVRAYLRDGRRPGVRRRMAPDPLERFVPYLAARFTDDPHLWLTTLHDELVPLGWTAGYQALTRGVRRHRLRPRCEACAGVRGRDTIEIEHPPGAELQWDWFERRQAPWGGTAYVLLGTLSHSGRVRGVIAGSMDQPHLVEAMDGVLRRHGGTAREWRTDRLATVIVPGTRDVQPSFAPVAKHYGAIVRPCPPRRGNRKGVVEAAVRYLCGRWWRNQTATTMEEAQASLDRFCATVADDRPRGHATVGVIADAEPLLALPPAPYPAMLEVPALVRPDATVAFRGNAYSVPPGLAGTTVRLRHRLGSNRLELVAPSGASLGSHELRPAGAGATVRTAEHRAALEHAVLAAFTTARPCDRKGNHPPGPAALAAAAALRGAGLPEVRVDLARYAELAEVLR